MQIVIDIPESDYELARRYNDVLIACAHYIREGKPLPKGHRRLIEDPREEIELLHSDINVDMYNLAISDVLDRISKEDTIIEAEKKPVNGCGYMSRDMILFTDKTII